MKRILLTVIAIALAAASAWAIQAQVTDQIVKPQVTVILPGSGSAPSSPGDKYLQPDGVSYYLQPDGVSYYLQP